MPTDPYPDPLDAPALVDDRRAADPRTSGTSLRTRLRIPVQRPQREAASGLNHLRGLTAFRPLGLPLRALAE